LEVLVHPLRNNETSIANEYERILCYSPTISIYDVNQEIAKSSARLRAKNNLRTPDSIQLATALYYSANYFLTNDKRFKKIEGIEIIALEDM
jgi:predicted nucleic acid-binding protein